MRGENRRNPPTTDTWCSCPRKRETDDQPKPVTLGTILSLSPFFKVVGYSFEDSLLEEKSQERDTSLIFGERKKSKNPQILIITVKR